MKRSPFLCVALAIAVLLGAAPYSRAWALFGSKSRKELSAVEQMISNAQSLRDSGAALDSLELLRRSQLRLGKLAKEDPNFENDKVMELYNLAGELMSDISAKIKSGELKVPDPDEVMGASTPDSLESAKMDNATTEPAMPRSRMPNLVRTSTPDATTATDETQDVAAKPAESAKMMSSNAAIVASDDAIVNPLFATKSATATRLSAVDPDEDATPAPKKLPSIDELRLRNLKAIDMIRTGRSADAVIMLGDAVEDEGDDTDISTRLLLVRALVECRNYKRAARELDDIPSKYNSEPAVRSLRATVAIATGDLQKAMLQLDRLLSEYPDYADVYINLAYVEFMMDPANNRDSAIEYYKIGLKKGATRDARLEKELRVVFGRVGD